MSKRKILVLNGRTYGISVRAIADLVYDDVKFLREPKSFDLVLFTGGADITPELYGDTSPKGVCSYSLNRDKHEFMIYKLAIRNGIKMAGICRGLQFFNCMAGGKMIHHLDNHECVAHKMLTTTGEEIRVNSLHHQAIIPPSNAMIVGITKGKLSTDYIGDRDEFFDYHGSEVEAAIFPKHGTFGVQYHPEMMHDINRGHTFFLEMVDAAMELPWDKFISAYKGQIDETSHSSADVAAS